MAAVSVTASEVQPGSSGVFEAGVAGEDIAAGQVVYYDSSAKTFKLSDADGAPAYGIAVCGAAAGQIIVIQLAGTGRIIRAARAAPHDVRAARAATNDVRASRAATHDVRAARVECSHI
jgi:hypothetical protein